MRKLIIIAFALLAAACVPKKTEPQGSYVGTSYGKYATVYFVSDRELNIAFENTSSVAMKNLVVVVRQLTNTGGLVEFQDSVARLGVKSIREITLPYANGSTGDIEIEYFFFPAPAALGMSPDVDESGRVQSIDDRVRIKVSIQ